MAYGSSQDDDITLPAAADLSSHQYKFITPDANGRGTITTTAVIANIGILQNKPDAVNKPARIRHAGISKLLMGAAVDEGGLIGSNLQGFGTAVAAGQVGVFIGAIALAAVGGSGDIGDVLLTRFIL